MCIDAVCSIWFRQHMFEVKEFGWKIDPPCGCGQAETGGLGHVTPSPVSIYVQSMVGLWRQRLAHTHVFVGVVQFCV